MTPLAGWDLSIKRYVEVATHLSALQAEGLVREIWRDRAQPPLHSSLRRPFPQLLPPPLPQPPPAAERSRAPR